MVKLNEYECSTTAGAVLGKNIWGAWPPGPYPEMWSGGSGAEGVDGSGVWGGGIPFLSGCGVWAPPPQKKNLTFSPSKWCILMHSGARFRPTRPIILPL